MAIVGGFIGGGVEMVPAGHIQLIMQWNTEDRLHLEGAVFTIQGINGTTGQYTSPADASGRAERIVPTGDYQISVTHAGTYKNDGPQTVIGESTQSYLIQFDAYFEPQPASVTFVLPESNIDFSRVTMQLYKEGTMVASVLFSGQTYVFGTDQAGDFRMDLSYLGVTHTETISIPAGVTMDINLSNRFKRVSINRKSYLASFPLLVNGFDTASLGLIETGLWVLKEPNTFSLKDDYLYQDNATKVFTITPILSTQDDLDETITPVIGSSSFFHITEDGEFIPPFSGVWNVKCFGGGGCGGYYFSTSSKYMSCSGSGGGHLAEDDLALEEGESYPITIGLGGQFRGDRSATGQPTSFGNSLSANGGSPGRGGGSSIVANYDGASGGTGGGACWPSNGTTGWVANGGDGAYGGGGGGICQDSLINGKGGDGGKFGGGGSCRGTSSRGKGGKGGELGGRGYGYDGNAQNGTDTTSFTHLEFAGMQGRAGASNGGGGGYGGNGGVYEGGGGGGVNADGGRAATNTGGGGGGGYGGKGGNGVEGYGGGGGGGYGPSALCQGSGSAMSHGVGYGAGTGGIYTSNSTANMTAAPGIVVVTFGKNTEGWY